MERSGMEIASTWLVRLPSVFECSFCPGDPEHAVCIRPRQGETPCLTIDRIFNPKRNVCGCRLPRRYARTMGVYGPDLLRHERSTVWFLLYPNRDLPGLHRRCARFVHRRPSRGDTDTAGVGTLGSVAVFCTARIFPGRIREEPTPVGMAAAATRNDCHRAEQR